MAVVWLLTLLSIPLSQAWLFTLPKGSCDSFVTCQDCVVEYSLDQYNIRRPCTWCPATKSCEMMNQWTETCSTGATYRDTCPVVPTTNLPRCVTIEYSFWSCERARPRNPDTCDQEFVDGFCFQHTWDRSLHVCNGDSLILETVGTIGFGQQDALSIAKKSYGLEMNLQYFWVNGGAGEDRRRIETTFSDAPTFLCNAQLRPDQAIVVKYRILATTLSGSIRIDSSVE